MQPSKAAVSPDYHCRLTINIYPRAADPEVWSSAGCAVNFQLRRQIINTPVKVMDTTLTTPEQIARYRFSTLRAALKLEIAGMKKRGASAYTILKAEGFTGTRAAVLQQLTEQLREQA